MKKSEHFCRHIVQQRCSDFLFCNVPLPNLLFLDVPISAAQSNGSASHLLNFANRKGAQKMLADIPAATH